MIDDFSIEKRGSFRLCFRREEAVESLLRHLLPEPKERLASAIPLPGRGRDSRAYRLSLDGREYFIKHYRTSGLVGRSKDLLRGSRPMRILRLGWQFLSRGMPIPRPLAVIENGYPGFAADAWLVAEFQPGRSLWEAWREVDDRGKKGLLANAGTLLGRMHGSGCLHGDTHWGNLLVTGEKGEELILIDFDGGEVLSSPDFSRIQKDIQHFFRDLFRQQDFRNEFRDFFTAVWLRRLPREVRQAALEAEDIVAPHFSRRRKRLGIKAVRQQMLRHAATAAMAGLSSQIWNSVEAITTALSKGKKVIVLGDEGAEREVEKFASELAQPFAEWRQVSVPLTPGDALPDGEDSAFDLVSRVDVEACPGDIVFSISSETPSENLLRALRRGKERGCPIIGLLGRDAGRAAAIVDEMVNIPAINPAQIRDAQAAVLDILCRSVSKTIFIP